jgi:predicted extracellular nuclease
VGSALADPITWNITSSSLTPTAGNTGPSSISGTFVYDADSNTTSEVNVTIKMEGVLYALTASGSNVGGYVRLMAANSIGGAGAYVAVRNLTNAGGSITEDFIGVGVCTTMSTVSPDLCSNLSTKASPSDPITLTGIAPPTPVPTLPFFGLLLLGGLMGLFGLRQLRG